MIQFKTNHSDEHSRMLKKCWNIKIKKVGLSQSLQKLKDLEKNLLKPLCEVQYLSCEVLYLSFSR